jgi:hypothetical protein
MSTRSYDSSTLTQFRQARALYSYNAARSAAVQAGTSVRPEQSGGSLNAVLIQRNLGGPRQVVGQQYAERGCACASTVLVTQGDYPANGSTQ